MLDSIVWGIEHLDPVTDVGGAMEAVELAHDTRVIAEPLPGTEKVVTTARLAEACARAAARGEHVEAGRLAADCLVARRAGAGDVYVLAEAAAVLQPPAS